MQDKKLKVLFVIEQCNPEWPSVPLVGYNIYNEVSKLAEVTLVTHERNKAGLESVVGERLVHYIPENKILTRYFKLTDKLVNRGAINWPLYHFLNYPLYASFNRLVYKKFHQQVRDGEYDIVHALTPMMPRFPVKISKACTTVPFILGPVNGGVPFPKGFESTARKEFAHFNFLRAWGRILIPGYKQTYLRASKILVGSTYTMEMLNKLFSLPKSKLELLYENGVDLPPPMIRDTRKPGDSFKVLFVGRLVPYKGADMLIEGIAKMPLEYRERISVIIVGDGPERSNLEEQCYKLGVAERTKFIGWVKQADTLGYYRNADIFCFPSIREFGGAVVLEAMSCALPCLVVDNGGIGEYITSDVGYKIEPKSRQFIVDGIASILMNILDDDAELQRKGRNTAARVAAFLWDKKALRISEVYSESILSKQSNTSEISITK